MGRTGNSDFSRSNSQHRIGRILASRAEKPMMAEELRAALHMPVRSLTRHLGHLRGVDGSERLIRVARYKFFDDRHHPVFALGTAKDAKIPKLSAREKSRRHRAAVKSDPDREERRRARESARWAVRKATSKPHGIFAALGL